MRQDDVGWAKAIADEAFSNAAQELYGRSRPNWFPKELFTYRLTADPGGCFAALEDGQPAGVLISVARGTVGWFGPLAVAPKAHGHGIGQALVAACIEARRARGVRLMGLETFAVSSRNLHLYAKFGFRPAWTGLSFQKDLVEQPWPDGVEVGGDLSDLDFLYPGFDPHAEVQATRLCGVGETFVTEGGFAICHLHTTRHTDPAIAFIPLLVAQDPAAFHRLLDAAESLSHKQGKTTLTTRIPGSCWDTYAGLHARGYRMGTAMVRMKMGENLDYDRPDIYYCDNWL